MQTIYLSSSFLLPVGMPQGSTLGPKVFSLYCHDLINCIPGTLVTYADDSYILISSKDEEDLKKKSEQSVAQHLRWLRTNGMVCNTEKTEVLVLGCKNSIEISVDNQKVKSKKELKVLGILFFHGRVKLHR
jgi:hypothetical protein